MGRARGNQSGGGALARNRAPGRRDCRRRAKNRCSRADSVSRCRGGRSSFRAAPSAISPMCERPYSLRGQKIGDDFGRDDFAPAGPDRQHAGLAGHFAPLLGDVVDEKRVDAGHGLLARRRRRSILFGAGRFGRERVHFEANAQRGIADHQRGIGLGEHGGGIGRRVDEFGGDAPESVAEQARERDGAARVGVERNALGQLDGLFRQHQDAAHFALGRRRPSPAARPCRPCADIRWRE